MPAFSIYHSFRFFGRSANITASLLYAVGNFTGELFNQERSVYRSGLLDFGTRFSVNLYGGRAMELPQFAKWKQKVLLGASLRVVAPTGQSRLDWAACAGQLLRLCPSCQHDSINSHGWRPKQAHDDSHDWIRYAAVNARTAV